jgi:Ni,Fe-hydrogenase III large subunit
MSRSSKFMLLANGESVPWADIPEWRVEDFVGATAAELNRGARLVSWFGVPEGDHGLRLLAVLAYDADNMLGVGRSQPARERIESLTPRYPQAHLFEREVFEQHGLRPEGHPWLKPLRRYGAQGPGVMEFYKVHGAEVHEVAVGPVHAGIIEPGHFRFQCSGEEVLHLEIALGYQHRGIEERLSGGPHRTTLQQIEAVAGDTTIGHATAHAIAMEALCLEGEAPLRAQWLRAVALELERLANHAGDLGALAGDVAFLPTQSACGKLRGDLLNLTAAICGNRFGRGLVRPGGCRHDLEPDRRYRMLTGLEQALEDVQRAVEWMWDAAAVRARFENTGPLTADQARELGLVGPAARACGLVRDVRFDQPAGWHRFAQIPVAVWPSGDVFARARVRTLEIQRSGQYVMEQLGSPPEGATLGETGQPKPDTFVVALVEGWRGEICHAVLTGGDGRFRRYKITDPSFHNWNGLALALRGQAISDFPVCNKSFNLSYCGFDL